MMFFVLIAPAQNTFPGSGNVGIGTATPGELLEVNGNAKIDGYLVKKNTDVSNITTDGTSSNAFYFNSIQLGGIFPVGSASPDGFWPGNSLVVEGNGAGGLVLDTYGSGPILFGANRTLAMAIAPPTGYVWTGTAGPNASLQIGNPSTTGGTVGVFSSVLRTFSSTTLSSSAGTDLSLASVGFATENNVALGIHAFRVGTGSTWTSTAIGIGMDVDNTTRAGANIWLNANGNVGIGTTAPAATLDIAGNVKLSGSGASISFPGGTVQATAWNGTLGGGDYAESVDVSGDRQKYHPGDVLVIDPKVEGRFLKSTEPYSTNVMGIYSTKPGLVGRRQLTPKNLDEVPMAMMGVVPAKVSAENGPVHPGDLLVSSSIPGYAMKGTDRSKMVGALIGKAMGTIESGTGVIEVAVALQ